MFYGFTIVHIMLGFSYFSFLMFLFFYLFSIHWNAAKLFNLFLLNTASVLCTVYTLQCIYISVYTIAATAYVCVYINVNNGCIRIRKQSSDVDTPQWLLADWACWENERPILVERQCQLANESKEISLNRMNFM